MLSLHRELTDRLARLCCLNRLKGCAFALAQEAPQGPSQSRCRCRAMRRQSCSGNLLFTAPAALDMASAGLPAAVNPPADHSQLPVPDLTSRGFSADLGMPVFAPQPRPVWPVRA